MSKMQFMIWKFAAVFLGAVAVQAAAAATPPIHHVFLVVLENEGAGLTFGKHSPAPYLARDLVAKGAFVENYFATGHYSLDNYIAMISGQAPNPTTQGDCQTFSDFSGNTLDADGQAVGTGCVYPANVPTLADQLAKAQLTWKSYSEDMGNDPARESAACGHPALNTPDGTEKAEAATASHPADQYASRHNPFVYFHSIIDSDACKTNVVSFASLQSDLQSVATTANFNFITPNLCNDGHDGGRPTRTCVDGRPGGLVTANAFLKQWIPLILASPAYQQDGLLIVTFDEADIDVGYDAAKHAYFKKGGDVTSCCNEKPGPNIDAAATVFNIPDEGPGVFGPGGGRIGAVVLSPFTKAMTLSKTPYNHYALLRTLEDIFGLAYLGYAGQPGLQSFGRDVFSATRHVK
ncbi:MAG: alkaline phosphatase family protein [Rhizomicrobium sp.]|jgi:hypothetical protein